MEERLASLVNEIRNAQDSLRRRVIGLREADPSLVLPVRKDGISVSVCAVDGGLLAQRLHGHDLVVSRAVGVNFIYEDSNLKSFDYHPGRYPRPTVEIRGGLDEFEANTFRSLVRLKGELECAISCVDKFKPQLMLMDGSLWTVPSDRPPAGSSVSQLYEEVIGLYRSLYSTCEKNGALLCGVIKDSRSKRLAKDLGLACSDTVLCSYLLAAGQRTASFNYFESQQKEPQGYWDKLKAFYLKPSESDLPLRIEFLGADDSSVASRILSLSAISENFAYPAILVEADMRAALEPNEMLEFESAFSGLKPLRRDSRPFR